MTNLKVKVAVDTIRRRHLEFQTGRINRRAKQDLVPPDLARPVNIDRLDPLEFPLYLDTITGKERPGAVSPDPNFGIAECQANLSGWRLRDRAKQQKTKQDHQAKQAH